MNRQQHFCEDCRRPGELYYSRRTDEYLCDECISRNAASAELDALFDSPERDAEPASQPRVRSRHPLPGPEKPNPYRAWQARSFRNPWSRS